VGHLNRFSLSASVEKLNVTSFVLVVERYHLSNVVLIVIEHLNVLHLLGKLVSPKVRVFQNGFSSITVVKSQFYLQTYT